MSKFVTYVIKLPDSNEMKAVINSGIQALVGEPREFGKIVR